ncbi:extracellular solute-binding protein [Sphingomonas sp. CFBP 13720]|uniref:extracellular solute-binding protein n=1 Tax=Sphingomonas sp. CFBP 13720 TaxID=2775302 RepID=UPI001784FDDA|nr:extracellular solute-binding protein [Sphingomonas sp. CFBP 13720]MBD8679498.1 extracellular solute-binding protein [Sphingomonas sp. CFBP 13720]
MSFRGLTWDHPRGYNALAAAGGGLIAWDKHPLEGFESRPIADQCALYDLVVLDHPHVGEAVASDCLVPLETLFAADELAAWGEAAIGPSLASYRYAGHHWALPLDAATQVMAIQHDLGETPPATWDAVILLAERVPVALSLAGPHGALSFQSICGALADTSARPGDRFVDRALAKQAYALMARLTGDATRAAAAMNPIAMLEAMASGDGPALCPLIYGYVNYAAAGRVRYADAPRGPGGRIGSTLGGTGVAVSRRAKVTPELLDHLRWLLSDATQRGFIPTHDGQPSLRSAWTDPAVDAAAGGFYSATRATTEAALVRPRHDHAIAFQTAASAAIRTGLLDGTPADTVLDAVDAAYTRYHTPGAET